MADCIFCKIAQKEIPAEIIFENDDIIAFNDVNPIAPVHVLIIPKKHIKSVAELQKEDAGLMGEIIVIAKKIAEDLRISQNGYKLLIRVGKYGGQEVDHLHLHLIGGVPLSEEIKPIS
jgi:histidine triad (HIT) family protein